MTGRIRVMLLFGGRSAEHDVSRVSAAHVARALDPTRYEVRPVAITTDGRWLIADEARRMIESNLDASPLALPASGIPVAKGDGSLVPYDDPRAALDVDVVVPLLHGPYGEDGTVQGLLELAGLPYVGSGVIGSAVGMDKVMMKRAFAAAGLPTPRHLALREFDIGDDAFDRIETELGYPCFVKPANMGSSVGVSKAADRKGLETAIKVALRYDEWILVEEAVTAREIEVAILGDHPPEASRPGEVIPGADFYSYDDKYTDDRAQLLAPAPISPELTAAVQALAVRAFDACRCEAMARVDFFLEETGSSPGQKARGFLVNELNTIPGFTPISMYPRLWEVSGVPYPKLLDRLIELAIERHERRARRAGRQLADEEIGAGPLEV